MDLKPQDLLVALKLAVSESKTPPAYAELASSVGLSASEVYQAVRRCRRSGLIHDGLVPDREALVELVIHGIRYLMPAERGAATRGMPTSHGVSPLKELLANGDTPPPVWPDPEGTIRGEALKPIYRSVPAAARQDHKLHECLALVDAMRAGRARERAMAKEHFTRMICPIV
jgi:DNA-binding Lrp family transcriptional regulator